MVKRRQFFSTIEDRFKRLRSDLLDVIGGRLEEFDHLRVVSRAHRAHVRKHQPVWAQLLTELCSDE